MESPAHLRAFPDPLGGRSPHPEKAEVHGCDLMAFVNLQASGATKVHHEDLVREAKQLEDLLKVSFGSAMVKGCTLP